jgi:hypothetical protein
MKPTPALLSIAAAVALPLYPALHADPQTGSEHNKAATAALQSAQRPVLRLAGTVKEVLPEGAIVESDETKLIVDEGNLPAGPRPEGYVPEHPTRSEVHGTILLRNYSTDAKVGWQVWLNVSPDGTWTDKDGKVFQAYRAKAAN